MDPLKIVDRSAATGADALLPTDELLAQVVYFYGVHVCYSELDDGMGRRRTAV